MQKGQFSCELSGTGEGVSITKKPRKLKVLSCTCRRSVLGKWNMGKSVNNKETTSVDILCCPTQ